MYGKNVELGGLLKNIPYKDQKSVESHVLQVIHQIPSLRPSCDSFISNDGRSQLLFKLEGTIPITYQMKTYHIPVAFWFPLDYPISGPRCFVTPVSGMKVKPRHQFVDSNGVIYHPLISQWHYARSSLVQLIGTLCSEFGNNPPVYATGPSQPQPSHPQPLHAQQSHPLSHQPQSHPQLQSAQSQPYPSSSPLQDNKKPSPMMNPNQPHQQSPNLNPLPGYNYPNSSPQPNLNSIGGGIGGSGSGISNQNANTSNIKEQFTNQLKKYLQEIYEQENAQINLLSSQQKKLDEHASALDVLKEQVKKEHSQLTERKTVLTQRVEFLEQSVEQNQSSSENLDVNKVVLCSDIWSEQCMEATAQDFAITDVMLELDRALEDETIDLTAYLKQLRKLSRDQFMKRALAKRVYDTQTQQVANANQQKPF